MKFLRLLLPLFLAAQLGAQTIYQNVQAASGTYTDNTIFRRDGTANRAQTSAITIADVASTNVTLSSTTGNSLTLATLDGNKPLVFSPHGSGSNDFRNGATSQVINLYNTYTSSTNYERLTMIWTGNKAFIYPEAGGGGGTNRSLWLGVLSTGNLEFGTSGLTRWLVGGLGGAAMKPDVDIVSDLGAIATRVRQLFIGPTGLKIGDGTNGPTITASGSSPNESLVFTAAGTGGVAVDGTATNDAAAAGFVGELLSAQLAAASTTSLVTATGKTITSVSLTAGDWEVSGTVHFIPANTTVVASLIASVSAADNTQASVDSVGGYASIGAVYTSGGATMSATPIPVRISLAATTTYYLVATATFSISTTTGYGTIRARRLR